MAGRLDAVSRPQYAAALYQWQYMRRDTLMLRFLTATYLLTHTVLYKAIMSFYVVRAISLRPWPSPPSIHSARAPQAADISTLI